jgi:hypothetical protein
MIIGLENLMVVTRSVVSTPAHLDVRERIATGKHWRSISLLPYLARVVLFVSA